MCYTFHKAKFDIGKHSGTIQLHKRGLLKVLEIIPLQAKSLICHGLIFDFVVFYLVRSKITYFAKVQFMVEGLE